MVWHDIEWTISVLLVVAVVIGPLIGNEVAIVLLFLLTVINLLVLVVFASLYISRDLSFNISEFLFFILWYPISSLSSLPFDILMDGAEPEHIRLPNLQLGVPLWMRHIAFVFSLFGLSKDYVVVLSITWFIAFRVFVSFLSRSAAVYEEESSNISAADGAALCKRPLNLPFIAAELMFATFTLGIYYHFYSLFEVAITMMYFTVSDTKLQRFITKQIGHCQFDILEGLEEYYFLGVLILMDCALCCVLFAYSLKRGEYLTIILIYLNGFVALMEFRIRVWKKIQKEQKTLEDCRRASSDELAKHNDICPVCLCVMTSARVTKCGHLFHGRCLRLSLNASPSCPVCKEKLSQAKPVCSWRRYE